MPEFSDFPWVTKKDLKHLQSSLPRMPWQRKKSWTDRVSEKAQDYYEAVVDRVPEMPWQASKSLKDRMPDMPWESHWTDRITSRVPEMPWQTSKSLKDRVPDMPWESHWTDRVTSRVPRMPWQSKGIMDKVSDIEMPEMHVKPNWFVRTAGRILPIAYGTKFLMDRADDIEMPDMPDKADQKKSTRGGLPTWLWFFLALPIGFYGIYLWRRRQERQRWYNWQRSESAFRERQTGESYNPQSREAFMGESAPADAANSLPTSTPIGGGGSGDEAYTRNVRAEDTNLVDRFREQDMGLTFTENQPGDVSPVSDEAIAADLKDEENARMEEAGQVAVTGGYASDTMEAEADTVKTGKPDDLTVVEGIGPSINNLLRSQGITTLRQLADTSLDRLDEILRDADLRRIADPGTWPEQARMAAEGDMEALTRFQNTLKAGRRQSR